MTLHGKALGRAIALLAVSATSLSVASAQTSTQFSEAEDGTLRVMPFDMTVDQLEDMRLYMDDGQPVGEIDTLLVDTAGTPVAFVIDPDDGIQVEDDGDLVITIDQVSMGDNLLTTNLSQDSIERLPRRAY